MSDKRWDNIWKNNDNITWLQCQTRDGAIHEIIMMIIIDFNGRQEMGQHMKEHKRDLIKCNVDWWAKDLKKIKLIQKVGIWHNKLFGRKHSFNRCNFFTFDPEQSLLHAAQHREDEKNRCHIFLWKKVCHLLTSERQWQRARWSIQLALPFFTVESGKRIGTNQKLC